MELKNAMAVCLISLVSATLVVLIARSLDSQAASRLEPQLAAIVEELQALRQQGGIAAASGEGASSRAADDALMVYYFHGVRCPTCRAAEATAHAFLQDEYASLLESGRVVWKVRDYQTDPEATAMARRFEVTTATIVLVGMKAGEIDTWNRLDRVRALAVDRPALSEYLREEIDAMLAPPNQEPAPPSEVAPIPIPVPIPLPVPSDEAEEVPVLRAPTTQNGGEE